MPARPASPPLGPVRGALGHLLQGAHHHLLHLGVGDRARHPRTGLVAQPVQPAGQEPGPPLPDGGPADAQPRGHGDIGPAVRAGQHDPRPQRQPLRGLPPLRPALQRPPLGLRQHQRLQPRITHATSRPRIRGPVTAWLWPETKHDSRGERGTQDRDTRRYASLVTCIIGGIGASPVTMASWIFRSRVGHNAFASSTLLGSGVHLPVIRWDASSQRPHCAVPQRWPAALYTLQLSSPTNSLMTYAACAPRRTPRSQRSRTPGYSASFPTASRPGLRRCSRRSS